MKRLVPVLLATLIIGGGSALASSEHVSVNGAAFSALVNQDTCKLVTPEKDHGTKSFRGLRIYVLQEDAIHDAVMGCLRRHMNAGGAYRRVSASGHGQKVVVTCPAKTRVMGGGATSEVEASYPSSDTTWTVTRDHLSDPNLVAWAVCAS